MPDIPWKYMTEKQREHYKNKSSKPKNETERRQKRENRKARRRGYSGVDYHDA